MFLESTPIELRKNARAAIASPRTPDSVDLRGVERRLKLIAPSLVVASEIPCARKDV
jgi:hypothetical protein